MKLTSFLRLKKPEGTDPVNVDDLNDNMDALDTAIQGLQTADGDISNAHVYTTAAGTRANVDSGDTMAVAFGKLMKLYSDLKGGAFSTVANNDTVTAEGYVADARIAKTHGDEIDSLATRTTALETSFPAGCNTLVSKCTSCGSTPASNAPADIATAIQNIYNNRYNAGVSAVTLSRSGRTVNASNGQSISVPYTGTNGSVSCSTSGGTGNQTFNITDGWATEVVVDRSGAYNAGSNAVTLSTSGRTVTASNGKTASVAYAGTNGSVSCSTGAGTGNQTFNITDGWATQVVVDRTGAYNAGNSAAKTAVGFSVVAKDNKQDSTAATASYTTTAANGVYLLLGIFYTTNSAYDPYSTFTPSGGTTIVDLAKTQMTAHEGKYCVIQARIISVPASGTTIALTTNGANYNTGHASIIIKLF